METSIASPAPTTLFARPVPASYLERLLKRAALISTSRVREAETTYRHYRVADYDAASGECQVARVLSDGQTDPAYTVNVLARTCDCPDYRYTVQRINDDARALGIDAGVDCKHCLVADLHIACGSVGTLGTPDASRCPDCRCQPVAVDGEVCDECWRIATLTTGGSYHA